MPNLLTLYPTWEAAAQAMIDGTFPIDMGPLNPAGCEQIGDDLNKANLLSDAAAVLLGIPETSVPNDAFLKLALGIGEYGYAVHVQFFDGTPAQGVTVSGLTKIPGKSLVTDANGNVVGTSTATTVTITATSPWLDINTVSQTATSNGILTDVTLTMTAKTGYATITSSGTYKLSPKVITYDLTVVGAGGGGTKFYWSGSGTFHNISGGGGGYVNHRLGIQTNGKITTLTAEIGAGGTNIVSNNKAGDGGRTSVTDPNNNFTLSALGGSGGEVLAGYPAQANGNGKGGAPLKADPYVAKATDGSGYIFNESALGPAGGGGGGATAQAYDLRSYTVGGAPFGGNGCYPGASSNVYSGGTAPNGPGGGGSAGGYDVAPSFAGYRGALYVRWHHGG